jgi:hypothetical protein
VEKAVYTIEDRLVFLIETKPGAVVRQEMRAARTADRTKSVEWAEARHGSDGSAIWSKSAWLRRGNEKTNSPSVDISDSTMESFMKALGDGNSEEPPIAIVQDEKNSWIVAVDISISRLDLDIRWAKTSNADLNSKLSLIYESANIYVSAKWGFVVIILDLRSHELKPRP